MKLTVEDDPAAIERYARLKRARGWSALPCSVRFPGGDRTCTRPKGHRGPHASHGWFGRVLAVWDSAAGGPSPAGKAGPPPSRSGRADVPDRRTAGLPSRRPVGLPSRRPTGLLQALWARVVQVLSDVEGVALLLMFVAFVGFAVHWLLLMLG